MTANIRHSNDTCEWYTPHDIIAKVRDVLGGTIDFDPASCTEANKIVQANEFITKDWDALKMRWWFHYGNCYMNPPSGKRNNRSYPGLFWSKLMDHRRNGRLTDAIVMGYSLEQLALTQNYDEKSMLDFTICVPRKRIHFVHSQDIKRSPSHSNVIVYVDGDRNERLRFQEVFSELGKVKL